MNNSFNNDFITHSFTGSADFGKTVTITISKWGDIEYRSKPIVIPVISAIKYSKEQAIHIISTWILNRKYWHIIKDSDYNIFLMENIFAFVKELIY